MIMRASGMLVARADGEAELAIERRRRVEIAHGVNDVIEAASHDHPAYRFRLVCAV